MLFELNQTFKVLRPTGRLQGTVRVVSAKIGESVALARVDLAEPAAPIWLPYDDWVLLPEGALERCEDPFETVNWSTDSLPEKAKVRLDDARAVFASVFKDDSALESAAALSAAIRTAVAETRTTCTAPHVRNWVYVFLQAGREARAVVRKFCGTRDPRVTSSGLKRGRKPFDPNGYSDVPIHAIRERLEQGLEKYYFTGNLTLEDAKYQILLDQFKVPKSLLDGNSSAKLFLDKQLLDKYQVFSDAQIASVMRAMKAARTVVQDEAPRGKRGKVTDRVDGPGWFEIDATYLQVQLVSRFSKTVLVGRCVIYLVIDLFSEAIVGYSIALGNCSYRLALSALLCTVTDKGPIFKRLGVPLTSKDWDAHELGGRLTADRAELVSNRGREVAKAEIDIRITPSMCPIAKGTVEGTNSQTKRAIRNIDIGGQYEKVRERRAKNGKDSAAHDLDSAESILVEAIVDLNKRVLPSDRIPLDAVGSGPAAMTRIGLYKWGLEHRPGMTRAVPANFKYEHLMTRAKAQMTPQGLMFMHECFVGDALRTLGWFALTGRDKNFVVSIAYDESDGGSIHFLDSKRNEWHVAYNTRPELTYLRLAFSELRALHSRKSQVRRQAGAERHEGHMQSQDRQRARVAKDKKEKRRQIKEGSTVVKKKGAIEQNRAHENRIRAEPLLQPDSELIAHAQNLTDRKPRNKSGTSSNDSISTVFDLFSKGKV